MIGIDVYLLVGGIIVLAGVAWKYWPKADVNADGKVDTADVKAAVEKVEAAAVEAAAEVVEKTATKVAGKARATKTKAQTKTQTKGKGKK